MPPQNSASAPEHQFPFGHALFILAIFLLYGSAVRKGIVRGSGILWAGVLAGALAVGIYSYDMIGFHERGAPLGLAIIPPITMAALSVFCVAMSYSQQRIRDIATFTANDTKVIVRVCPAILIPDADAALVPVTTALHANDRASRAVLDAAGPQVADALAKLGPVGMGKVVPTVGGALAVGQIFHVAVSDSGRPVDAARLRRGLEGAAQQARKAGAESLVIPLGNVPGLSPQESLSVPVEAVLRQRKAFAEIVFVVFEPRLASLVSTIVSKALPTNEDATIVMPSVGKIP